jgi:hypothetical protein
MSKNISCIYMLLVKQASLATLHAFAYGCEWFKRHEMIPYEPHVFFLFYIIVGGERAVGITLALKTK